MSRVKIELPFSGFYYTVHDARIDEAIESFYNYDYENDSDIEVPDKVKDAIYMADVNWQAIRDEYCKSWVEAFADHYELDIKYDEIWTPKAHNYANDRLFATIPREQIDKIRKEVEASDKWAERVKEVYTSYSGFSSNYEPDIKHEDWTKEILDECQYGTMLEFWLEEISPETRCYWSEREYFLTEDFEMSNWDSVYNAYLEVEKELRKEEK